MWKDVKGAREINIHSFSFSLVLIVHSGQFLRFARLEKSAFQHFVRSAAFTHLILFCDWAWVPMWQVRIETDQTLHIVWSQKVPFAVCWGHAAGGNKNLASEAQWQCTDSTKIWWKIWQSSQNFRIKMHMQKAVAFAATLQACEQYLITIKHHWCFGALSAQHCCILKQCTKHLRVAPSRGDPVQ